MKTKTITMLALGGILMIDSCAFAQTRQDHGRVIDEKQAMSDIATKKAVDVGNKICPVSGDQVEGSKMGGNPVMYEYSGKIYRLCCPMCIKDFKKNPEKYSKIADDEVKAAKK
jgi:YHS domain-containing protein